MNKIFTNKLLFWLDENPRNLPWKEDKDAYSTWLSEIIMQQTRVEYGTAYYLKFKQLFPTVFDLANAELGDVIKAWEGLGYYSRARNLHATAKEIAYNRNGEFPQSSKELKQLKGIGPYTAAAIASFVFNEPKAAIDGNAYRVLSRYYGIATPIDSTKGKKEYQKLGDKLISKQRPGDFNQAVMNFGALICKPKQANCNSCTLSESCIAKANDTVYQLPKKEKKIKIKHRYFTYYFIHYKGKTYLKERIGKDVWQNLYEFPLVESTQKTAWEKTISQSVLKTLEPNQFKIKKTALGLSQQLSHQKIHVDLIIVELLSHFTLSSYQEIDLNELKKYPFPKVLNEILKK